MPVIGGKAECAGRPARSIPVKGQTFRAKVEWSNPYEIGVSFKNNAVVVTSPQSDSEPSGRVAQLEAEIVALRHTMLVPIAFP